MERESLFPSLGRGQDWGFSSRLRKPTVRKIHTKKRLPDWAVSRFLKILGLLSVNKSLASAEEAEEACDVLINVADLLDASALSSSVDTSVTSLDDTQDIAIARSTNLVTNIVTCSSNGICVVSIQHSARCHHQSSSSCNKKLFHNNDKV